MTTPTYALTGTLEALHSITDINGNRYWALRFTDHQTGKIAEGKVSGGESNVYQMLRYWNVPDGWDHSIIYRVTPMGKREFKRLTKDWPYAGCSGEEIAQFVREKIKSG
jgi:hypothetical protein